MLLNRHHRRITMAFSYSCSSWPLRGTIRMAAAMRVPWEFLLACADTFSR